MHIIYQSPKIIIREFLSEEKQTFFDLFVDKQVTQYLPDISPERCAEMFNELQENYKNKNLSRWAIFDSLDNSFIGMCVCLLYTSPSPRDQRGSRMPSSA